MEIFLTVVRPRITPSTLPRRQEPLTSYKSALEVPIKGKGQGIRTENVRDYDTPHL